MSDFHQEPEESHELGLFLACLGVSMVATGIIKFVVGVLLQ